VTANVIERVLVTTVDASMLRCELEQQEDIDVRVLPDDQLRCALEPQRDLAVRVLPEEELRAELFDLVSGTEIVEIDPMPSTVVFRVISGDELLDAYPDPHHYDVAIAVDPLQWTVMHVGRVRVPVGKEVEHIDMAAFWKAWTDAPGQTGLTKWAVSRQPEVPGLPPVEALDVSPEVAATATTGDNEQSFAGVVRSSALGVGEFVVMLLGRPSDTGHVVRASVSDQSEVNVTIL
jgi:hypothetical protein